MLDDFFAVMITNVYASELHRPLRRDHNGFQLLNRSAASVRSDPAFAGFFRSFATAMQPLNAFLAGVDTPFNPWRHAAAAAAP